MQLKRLHFTAESAEVQRAAENEQPFEAHYLGKAFTAETAAALCTSASSAVTLACANCIDTAAAPKQAET